MATLTPERLRDVLDYIPGTGIFVWKKKIGRSEVGNVAGYIRADGYRAIGIDGRTYKEHRLAWLHAFGVWPSHEIDHLNGLRGDNRLSNLREATLAQNRQNKRKPHSNNTTGFLGVSFCKQQQKWRASIRVNGIKRHLGSFDAPLDAYAAYLAAKKKHHPFSTISQDDCEIASNP